MTSGFLALLRPTGPWRLGHHSGSRDQVDRIGHSDTIFAAVSSAMLRLGMLEEWLAAAGDAKVRISSAFPFHGKTLFVAPPRNLWPPPPSSRLRWHGAKLVPVSVVADLLADKPIDENRWRIDGASECMVPVDRAGPGPTRVTHRTAAALDRLTGEPEPHSVACLEFAPGAGMWVAVDFADDDSALRWSDPVRTALRLLADTGIGGERSRGWGGFEQPEFRPGSIADLLGLPKPSEELEPAWWLLSLFQPGDGETIHWNRGRYDTVVRGGRVESQAGWGAVKKNSRMVVEGSVLISDFPPRGTLRNVAPDGFAHPVLRNGVALALPIGWKAVAS